MINGNTIKAKRVAAGIAGHVLCKRLSIARSRLSDIEREYITVPTDELVRLDAALEDLIRTQAILRKTAAALGWPVSRILP